MKRILCLFLVVCLLIVPVGAKEQYDTAWDLYQSWDGEYPDYVCGVWSTNGGRHLTIAVIDVDAQTKIQGLVKDKSSMTLTLQAHTHAKLKEILDGLEPYFKKGWIWTAALDEFHNRVVIGLNLDNRCEEMDAFVVNYIEQYGTAVSFEQGYPVTPLIGEDLEVGASDNQLWWLVLAAVVTVCGCAMLILRQKRRRSLLLQTTDGMNELQNKSSAIAEIVAQIQQSDLVPDAGLEERIRRSVQ